MSSSSRLCRGSVVGIAALMFFSRTRSKLPSTKQAEAKMIEKLIPARMDSVASTPALCFDCQSIQGGMHSKI
ncbi:hypothetical protein G6F59_017913 [Rhizopus arrhizus]|nr:hypothetical protein G6F59_017913 [Rhizopus arrhizus]